MNDGREQMVVNSVASDAGDSGGALVLALTVLATTPDDAPTVDGQLAGILRLAVDRVAAVDYASITALRDLRYTTVAASSELARAVDAVQYTDAAGPCIEALRDAIPVTVDDMTPSINWPGFYEAASSMGLRASVSIPLYVASGAPAAVLNLFSRDDAAMAPLIVGVWSVFDPGRAMPSGSAKLPALDPGGAELIEGFRRASAVRALIQEAMKIVMTELGCLAHAAYETLVARAERDGLSVADIAVAVVRRR